MNQIAKTKEELVTLLRESVEGFNRFRKENPEEKADLQGAKLQGANLHGVKNLPEGVPQRT